MSRSIRNASGVKHSAYLSVNQSKQKNSDNELRYFHSQRGDGSHRQLWQPISSIYHNDAALLLYVLHLDYHGNTFASVLILILLLHESSSWEDLGDGWALKFQETPAIPGIPSPCLVLEDQDGSSQLFLPSCLHSTTMGSSPLKLLSLIKCFLKMLSCISCLHRVFF